MKMANLMLSGIELLDEVLSGSLSMMECCDGIPLYIENKRKKYESMDAIDWFCANARNRLEILRKQGKHPEFFEPVLCHKQMSELFDRWIHQT